MSLDHLRKMYPELDEVQLNFRVYAFGCVAHRLRKFGFESGINNYQPRDLVALSMFMQDNARAALLREGLNRGFNMGVLNAG